MEDREDLIAGGAEQLVIYGVTVPLFFQEGGISLNNRIIRNIKKN